MFLHELNDEQRHAFMCLAARMASTDAQLHDLELAMLSQMRHEMDIPSSWRPSTATTTALLTQFTDHRSRTTVLLELLRLARCDQAVPEQERLFFIEAATAFGFSGAQVRSLLLWIRRHEALMAEAEQLMSTPPGRVESLDVDA
jgi:hypothetical protein